MSAPAHNPEEANKAAVRRLYLEGFNQEILAVADELLAPGLHFAAPGPGCAAGPEGFKENVRRLRTAFPDLHFSIEDMIGENDRVAVYWKWEGTHRGAFANIPPTGKRVRQEGMVLYQFAQGKAVKAQAQFDRLAVFQQLGANPPALPGATASQSPKASLNRL